MIKQSGTDTIGSPSNVQKPSRMSAYKQVSRVRWLIRVIWTAFAVLGLCLAMTAFFAREQGSFKLDQLEGDAWQYFGVAYTPIGATTGTTNWAGELKAISLTRGCSEHS
jgi:uncharacterized protein YjiK